MNEKNTEELIAIYPPLFQRGVFCFECHDGWFALLGLCIFKIGEVCKREKLEVFVTQVKEKFGTLRFYMSGETDEISKIIAEAERLSYNRCEICGQLGTLNNGPWFEIRCPEHKAERDKC